MNAVIASESFRYLRPDLNQPGIQIQGNVASWTRKTGGANKRPNFAARGGNKLRQLFRWHATSDYSRGNRLRIREFDFVGHTVVGLTSEVSDGDEPILASQLTLNWPAHTRSLDRLVMCDL